MKKLTLLMSALLIGVLAFAETPKVTLDFSTETAIKAWGLPADYQYTAGTYTSGGYSITITPNTTKNKGGFKGSTGQYGNYLMLRQTGSNMQLPTFDFAVSKILVYGNTNGGEKTKLNVFVGEKAVSTECTNSKLTHTFLIASDYQAVGNVYKIQVTNDKNQQITKVEVYEAVAGAPANVEFSLEEQAYIEEKELVLSCTTEGASIYYTTDGTEPTASSTLYDGAITMDRTMTVKAVAIKNELASEVVTKTITIVTTEGQGTKENPFTIADAKLLNDKYPGAQWVIGRIIGVFEENVPVVVDATAGTETVANLAITDGTDTIAVQLPNGSDIRTALNLKDHKEFVGRDIKVHGEILSYFQRAGIRNTDDYEFDGVSTALEEETATEQKEMKLLENGQVIIIRNGARYSITGVELK